MTFHKSKIFIELRLQDGLVPNTVRPIQMITYCKNDMASIVVDTYYIDYI